MAVSMSAAPIVVRFVGQAAEHVDPGDDADHAHPGGHEHEGDRDPHVSEAAQQRVDGEPEHDRRGAEPGGPVETDPLHERIDERAARDEDDDLRQHADGGERGRPPPVELQLQRHQVAEAGGRQPGRGLERQAAGDERVSDELEVEQRVARRTLAEDEEDRRPRRPPRWPPTAPTSRRPRSTNSVGATSASTIVAVPSTAPGDVHRIAVQVGRDVRGDAEPHADDREHGDRHVHQQQDLPRRDREHEATRRSGRSRARPGPRSR